MAMAQKNSTGRASDYDIQPEGLVLTKRPFKTLKFFTMALVQYLCQLLIYLTSHKLILVLGGLVLCGWSTLVAVEGPHEQVIKEASAYLQYALWWIGLGVASSIGLGSGLHTFVLYLGPHIAMFTIKATLCGRVDLKSAQYDTALFRQKPTWEYKECNAFGEPLFPRATSSDHFRVPVWPILHEVHWEAVLWGIGTALGELPPYFVSRAARLSGERLKEFDDLRQKITSDESVNGFVRHLNQLKSWTLEYFQQLNLTRFKFWTILLFASIPNPLFDFAGITCGQLLVPFWSFFIPTLIGKALVKTHLQTIFVILLCNNQLVELLESSLRQVFHHAPAVSGFVSQLLIQLEKIERNYLNGPVIDKKTSWKLSIPLLWDTLVWIMIIGFFSSFINATAQSYLYEKQRESSKQGAEDLSAEKRDC